MPFFFHFEGMGAITVELNSGVIMGEQASFLDI